MRPVVREEVSELAFRVHALPNADTPGNPVASRTARARNSLTKVEESSAKILQARRATVDDLFGVFARIAEINYELYAIDQLRLGHPTPERTEPCFLDPRHGPSEQRRLYAPTGMDERIVGVCGLCCNELDGGQRPPIRRLPRTTTAGGSAWANYWEADAAGAYVDGYWGQFPFPDVDFEESRIAPARSRRPDPMDLLQQRLQTDQD